MTVGSEDTGPVPGSSIEGAEDLLDTDGSRAPQSEPKWLDVTDSSRCIIGKGDNEKKRTRYQDKTQPIYIMQGRYCTISPRSETPEYVG